MVHPPAGPDSRYPRVHRARPLSMRMEVQLAPRPALRHTAAPYDAYGDPETTPPNPYKLVR